MRLPGGPMRKLHDIIPDAEVVLELEPEEVGLAVLRILNARNRKQCHAGDIGGELASGRQSGYPDEHAEHIQHAAMEGWAWLLGQGLLAPVPHSSGHGAVFVTRLGRRIVNEGAADEYLKA